jgi:hypothetical protein
MHSNVITVLNAEGEVTHQQTGLHGDTAGMIRAIRDAIGSSAAPKHQP